MSERKPFKRTHTMERLPMTPLEKLGEALETCIVACQGRRNTERAQAVLDVIKEQGWTLVPPGEDRMRDALRQCAAEWRSPPCTVSEGAVFLYQEFVRRAEIAGAALAPPEEEK